MFQCFILPIMLTVILFLFSKVKIEVTVDESLTIEIFLFRIIKIKEFKMNKDEYEQAKNKTDNLAKSEANNYFKKIEASDTKKLIGYGLELLERMKYEKLEFNLNVNVKDYILNAYINAFLNSVIAMLINRNIRKINTDNLNYIITTNENKTKLNLKCIMYGRFTNIIYVLLKVIRFAFEVKRKGNDGNGNRKGKGTSNRKFNGDSNVVA